MKVQILVPALITALSMVACAQNKKHASTTSANQPNTSAPAAQPTAPESKVQVEAEKKAEGPKLINAHGADLKCTDEFMQSYVQPAAKSATAAKNLGKTLVDIIPVLKNNKLNVDEIGNVKGAYQAFADVQTEMKSTIAFPFSCWLPADNGKKLTIASEVMENSAKELKTKVIAAIGSQNVK